MVKFVVNLSHVSPYQEMFVQACVGFLKRRCPQLFSGKMDESLQSKSQQLPPETVTTMLSCLQTFAGYVVDICQIFLPWKIGFLQGFYKVFKSLKFENWF